MAKISSLDTCQTLLEIWLAAFNEEAVSFLGEEAKLYLSRAYKAAAKNWIDALKAKYGLEIDKNVTTLKEAVEAYIRLGIEGGLFSSLDDFILEELKEGCALKITVKKCPYVEACNLTLEKVAFSAAQIPCPRIGCFKGAVEILLNVKCGYRVDVKENECVGIVFSLEENCKEKIVEFL
jgi:hypothetical protein